MSKKNKSASDFRRYLEKSGAIDSLTSVRVSLYAESDRPLDSTEYIEKFLGGVDASSSSKHLGGSHNTNNNRNNSGLGQHQQMQENDKVKKENDELKSRVHELNKTIETLRANLKTARAEAKKARDERGGGGGGN